MSNSSSKMPTGAYRSAGPELGGRLGEDIAPEISSRRYANRRDKRQFVKAKRHSFNVRLLKFALPTVALVLTAGFIGITMISTSLDGADISIEGTALSDGKLIMKSPKMNGYDKNNRAFGLIAKRAMQDLKTPSVIELEKIDAKLPVGKEGHAKVDAKNGVYDSDRETLVLKDNIKVRGMSGFDIDMQQANVDMKTGSLKTNKPVEVRSRDAQINADSMEVENDGKRIVFKKRVKMTIHRDRAEKQPVEPLKDN